VTGAALTKNEAQITVAGVPDQPGTSHAIFSKLAGVNVAVDMIVQNAGAEGSADISFTVLEDDLNKALSAVRQAASELKAEAVLHDASVSKVSIVGLGMATQTGVADRMFRALSDAGINIEAITTSEIKISVLVKREQALAALRAVHAEFELEKPPRDRTSFGEPASERGKAAAVDIVRRLQRMEDLAIESVSLDESQSQITIFDVQDRPGISAASSRRLRRRISSSTRSCRASAATAWQTSASPCRGASWNIRARCSSRSPANLAAK
jgi:aspartate kinase